MLLEGSKEQLCLHYFIQKWMLRMQKKNIYLGRYRKSTISEQRGQTMIVD